MPTWWANVLLTNLFSSCISYSTNFLIRCPHLPVFLTALFKLLIWMALLIVWLPIIHHPAAYWPKLLAGSLESSVSTVRTCKDLSQIFKNVSASFYQLSPLLEMFILQNFLHQHHNIFGLLLSPENLPVLCSTLQSFSNWLIN